MNEGGYASANAVQEAPKQATLNHRLNRVSEMLQTQCERLESVLSRVNGTPRGDGIKGQEVARISPTLPLAQVTENLDAISKRLSDLATGVESIA